MSFPVTITLVKTIYLVRHGKVDNPGRIFYTANFPLGNQGARQAQLLAKDIKNSDCNPVRILCSPYLRTRETAEIIAQELDGHEVETDDRLIEWQVGEWFGKPLDDFRVAAGYDEEPFHLKLKNIEQFEELSKRVIDAIHDVLKSLPEESCAIMVSHRESMVSAILKLENQPDWSLIPKKDFPPGSSWKLTFQDGEFIEASKYLDRSTVL